MLMGGYELVVAGQLIGMLTNVWAQHKNANRTMSSQKENMQESARNQRENLEFQAAQQRENILIQQRQQWRMQQEGYRQQIASQMRAYDLQNSWPLSTSPSAIANMIEGCKGNLPLFLVVAPEEQSGIQKDVYSVWTNIRNYFMETFRVNSDTPVIEGGYKAGCQVAPTQDYMKIYNGIKGLPTLYLAPYKTNRNSVLGITIAFWGRGDDMPIAKNVELDLRKLYVDTIREESAQYKKYCDNGDVEFDAKSPMARNQEIFNRENTKLSFEYRDQSLQLYKKLESTPATFTKMSDKLFPIIQLVSVGVVDSYFTLSFGTETKFPALAKRIREQVELPELSLCDAEGNSYVVNGNDFVNGLEEKYGGLVLLNLKSMDTIQYKADNEQKENTEAHVASVNRKKACADMTKPSVAQPWNSPRSKSFF